MYKARSNARYSKRTFILKTLSNLSYHGTNVYNNGSDDTSSNWGRLGNLATTFYTDSSGDIEKPSAWGLLLNIAAGVNTSEVHQLWFEQANGSVFHRGGNASSLNSWKRIVDNTNIGVISILLNITILPDDMV